MQTRTSKQLLGDAGETAAAGALERLGYRLLARNVHCRCGELDLVMEKDGVLCFVEVRTRANAVWGDPSGTVSWTKQRRVVKSALEYIQKARVSARMIRIDVVSVLGSGDALKVEHIPNAFDAGM